MSSGLELGRQTTLGNMNVYSGNVYSGPATAGLYRFTWGWTEQTEEEPVNANMLKCHLCGAPIVRRAETTEWEYEVDDDTDTTTDTDTELQFNCGTLVRIGATYSRVTVGDDCIQVPTRRA